MTNIEKILQYVSDHNGFYRDIVSRHAIASPLDITQYPIVSREMLQKEKRSLLSEEYLAHQLTNHLYTSSSSGTSGVPIEIFWNPNQYATSMLCLWRRRKKYYDISPSDKRVDFMLKYYNKMPDNKLHYTLNNASVLSVNRLNLGNVEVMAELLTLMKGYQPVWLQLSPSVMETIVNYCVTQNEALPKSIKYVEFMSEMLTTAMRVQTRELLPNAKIANMYGSEEMNTIAYECPCGKMHIISENVYAECFDGNMVLPHGKGEIILTNLHNRVNPLIRYNQKDNVVIAPEVTCECGYTDKILTTLSGRVSSKAVINGQDLTTCDVSDIMLIIANKFGHPIKKYKVIYDSTKDTILCYTIFNDMFINWHQEIWKMIQISFEEKYGRINLRFLMDDFDKNCYKHDLLVVK